MAMEKGRELSGKGSTIDQKGTKWNDPKTYLDPSHGERNINQCEQEDHSSEG